MRKKRFSVEQITAALAEAERGMPVAEISRKLGISDVTFYRWEKAYSGLEPSQVRELKQLKEENGKLKRIVADLSLDKVMLQDVLSKKF